MFDDILKQIREKIASDQYVMTTHVISCPHCGESYLSAETLHKIEEIKRDRTRAIERPVEVASFA